MNTATKALTALAAVAVLATPILAQQREGARLPAECREAIVALCGGQGQGDRAQMRTCLREKAAELPDTCRTALRERMEARGGREGAARRGGAEAPTPAPTPQTLSYGGDPLQALDLWVPEGATA
ncbi:MAG: alpha/beta hydrolase, partial [Erythrobacter sp.]|nr:alpha/beta hydrolase [Erythrobacter sp.]